jgi:hypothetical protein
MVTEDTPFVMEDDTYHSASDDPNWLETTWWSLNLPERRMGAWLHAGYHTNRRTVTWRVFLWDAEVPMPPDPDLREIEFPGGGFSVKMLTPLMDYHIAYADADAGFSLDFEHRSVHPPHRFTPGEPPAMHNPHLDQLGHVVGELTRRGERIPIDCYSVRDRTWGTSRWPSRPEPETGVSAGRAPSDVARRAPVERGRARTRAGSNRVHLWPFR